MNISNKIINSIKVGDVFQNSGKGTSTIKKIDNEKISYIRGKSTINLKFSDIDEVYTVFQGRQCSTVDLKSFKPEVFDSNNNGHSCNCTFLFSLLKLIDLIDGDIMGKGVRGSPFYVLIKQIMNFNSLIFS